MFCMFVRTLSNRDTYINNNAVELQLAKFSLRISVSWILLNLSIMWALTPSIFVLCRYKRVLLPGWIVQAVSNFIFYNCWTGALDLVLISWLWIFVEVTVCSFIFVKLSLNFTSEILSTESLNPIILEVLMRKIKDIGQSWPKCPVCLFIHFC